MDITIIGAAIDNIADWSNDSKTRTNAILTQSLSEEQTTQFLQLNATDGERIADQIVLIRNELASEPPK